MNKKNIAVCLDKEGNVIAQGIDTPLWKLPITNDGKFRTSWLWSNGENKVIWEKDLPPNHMEVSIMDLATGEVKIVYLHSIY